MRFLAVILLIAGLISGWFLLQDKRAENRAVARAAQLAARLSDPAPAVGVAETAKNAGANIYWILFYFDKLSAEGMDPGKVFDDACAQLKMPESLSGVLRGSLMANYEIAKKYRIFEDVTNVVKMEQGMPPLMKMSGWEEEPVILSHIIPPSIAPEAAGSLSNFILMPAIVHDAESGRITPNILEKARAMERAQIIVRKSLEELVAEVKKVSPDAR